MDGNLFFITVFFQGVASFLSPCVLPLIPAYLTYMTGQSVEIMMKDSKAHRTLILNSIAFIVGFSLVFVSLGAVATSMGKFLQTNRDIIRKVSAILIIFFGLFHSGLIPISFLNYEKRLQIKPGTPGIISSILLGIGFSFGWSPCIGPILTSVYIMASQANTVAAGMALLAVYALGLGLPFFLIAFGLRFLWRYVEKLYKHMKLVKIISGALLIIIGIMIYFNAFYFLAF